MKKYLTIAFMLLASVAQAQGKPINAADAKKKALALVPGKVIEVEREKLKGEPVFSVEIKGADGVHEIVIRVSDGKVLANKSKAAGDEDGEGEADSEEK